MNRLQDLVAQSSGTGSVFGFVGGVQTVAVWGMILVIVAGFVFLSLYFKKLGLNSPSVSSQVELPPPTPPTTPSLGWKMPATIALVVVLTSSVTILLTRLATPKPTPIVNQVTTTSPSPTPTPIPQPSPPGEILIKDPKSVLGADSPTHQLTVPEDSSVNVRNQPSSDADIIMAVSESQDVIIFKESGDWRQIGFKESDSTKGYWVHSKFIKEK